MNTENITLYYRQERSDKVYKVSLEEKEGGFIVTFAYGRRGSTLKTGTKTQNPVVYDKAKKIYDKLVLSKAQKGYVPSKEEDNTTYTVDTEQRKTGIHCQLLNPIKEDEIAPYIYDNNWWLQEKKDGKRMLIQKTETAIIAINRKGLSVGMPKSIETSAALTEHTFIIDGEAIGEELYVFDLLYYNGKDLKTETYQNRYELLLSINFTNNIKVLKSAKSAIKKQKLFDQLKSENTEGLVFKKIDSLYKAGRPNSKGDQVKFKFYDTASVIVSKVNDKRSVGLSVLDNEKEIFVGNVTIPSNKKIPKKDTIIEVRYLYAYKAGSLYQPTFISVRTDMDKQDCKIEQLKYKNIYK
ncbi:MAG: WGR domain-containing protein [Flavobacteriaceae bacterium]|nr:WGR domain-containing protein [Flavobacteriaceae bacterium]